MDTEGFVESVGRAYTRAVLEPQMDANFGGLSSARPKLITAKDQTREFYWPHLSRRSWRRRKRTQRSQREELGFVILQLFSMCSLRSFAAIPSAFQSVSVSAPRFANHIPKSAAPASRPGARRGSPPGRGFCSPPVCFSRKTVRQID
jgi:hypothetical protein